MSEDLSPLKRRMTIMIVVDVICMLVAAAAIVGLVTLHIKALGGVFAAAIGVGVAVQIWFIVSFVRFGAATQNTTAKA